jgi:hypothetical protein
MTGSHHPGAFKDLLHYENVARVLAKGLTGFRPGPDPLDVAETLEQLADEMENMPFVITDCRMAVEAFEQLESVLDRMYALADRAVELNDAKPNVLAAMDEEFGGYSHLVARLAGADEFDGPRLSLATSAEARVTRVILGCLSGARQGFARRLEEQRRRINDAMDDAMALLLRMLDEGEGVSPETRAGLAAVLERLRAMDDDFKTLVGRVPPSVLLN